jgi:hypothetical protein
MSKVKLYFTDFTNVIILIMGILIIFGFYYFSNNREEDSGGKKIIASVSINNLISVTPGDFIMDMDSTLFCVKNHPQKALTNIICYSAYGKRKIIFLNVLSAKKIIKIIKKGDPAYCRTAKKFLSTY